MTEIAYGEKYEGNLSITDIAKKIREEIKAAIKAGNLPKGLKVSIRTRGYSGGQSLDPTIMAVPEGFTLHNSEWVKATDANENIARGDVEAYTPEAKVVAKKIETMIWAYNYDGSDSMTDYFNVNFYGGHVAWDSKVEKADLARIRAKLNGEPAPDETPLEFGPEAVVKCLTEATHWTNWSASEVARDLHVGVDKARKVLDVMATEGTLFKTWAPRRQAIIYRLPLEGVTPESAKANREWADKEAAETKEARAATKAVRAKARQEYEEDKAREAKEVEELAAKQAAEEAEAKVAWDENEVLAKRTRAKVEAGKVVKLSLYGPTFTNKTIGWC